jgi:phosphatidylserine/phosphatidylglycerophosphate/cardiolipin synthase-like enzyme
MKELLEIIENSVETKQLNSFEKKAIKKVVGRKLLTPRQMTLLRNKLFMIAEERISIDDPKELLQWLNTTQKFLNTLQLGAIVFNDVYFSPGQDCLNAIIEAIETAKRSIKICVFTISDNRITQKIVDKHRQGVFIQIITDNDKTFDMGSDVDLLVKSGIECRIDNTKAHMHHKFAIFDNTHIVTGSYNWTRSAERYNHENIIVTNEPQAVHRYMAEFDKLWPEMDRLR